MIDPRTHVAMCEAEFSAGRASRDAGVAELRQKLEQWNEKAKNWTASPEAKKMLDGYRAMGAKCAELETERDQLRQQLAATEAKRADLEFVWNGCEQELENCKAERDQLRQQLAAALLWKEAVEHELIVAGIWNKSHENDPKKAVKEAIDWNVQVARDPKLP